MWLPLATAGPKRKRADPVDDLIARFDGSLKMIDDGLGDLVAGMAGLAVDPEKEAWRRRVAVRAREYMLELQAASSRSTVRPKLEWYDVGGISSEVSRNVAQSMSEAMPVLAQLAQKLENRASAYKMYDEDSRCVQMFKRMADNDWRLIIYRSGGTVRVVRCGVEATRAAEAEAVVKANVGFFRYVDSVVVTYYCNIALAKNDEELVREFEGLEREV